MHIAFELLGLDWWRDERIFTLFAGCIGRFEFILLQVAWYEEPADIIITLCNWRIEIVRGTTAAPTAVPDVDLHNANALPVNDEYIETLRETITEKDKLA